jgi:hypothetical protein
MGSVPPIGSYQVANRPFPTENYKTLIMGVFYSNAAWVGSRRLRDLFPIPAALRTQNLASCPFTSWLAILFLSVSNPAVSVENQVPMRRGLLNDALRGKTGRSQSVKVYLINTAIPFEIKCRRLRAGEAYI